MKRALVIVVVVAFASAAWGAGSDLRRPNAIKPGLAELGVNLGEPTGLSAKLWLDRSNALELIAAWAFSQGAFAISADYLINFPDVIKVETERFPLFVGIGGIIRFGGTPGGAPQGGIGLRVPLGVLYVFRDFPFEISLEIVPGLNLFPDTTFLAMGGLGIRYCF